MNMFILLIFTIGTSPENLEEAFRKGHFADIISLAPEAGHEHLEIYKGMALLKTGRFLAAWKALEEMRKRVENGDTRLSPSDLSLLYLQLGCLHGYLLDFDNAYKYFGKHAATGLVYPVSLMAYNDPRLEVLRKDAMDQQLIADMKKPCDMLIAIDNSGSWDRNRASQTIVDFQHILQKKVSEENGKVRFAFFGGKVNKPLSETPIVFPQQGDSVTNFLVLLNFMRDLVVQDNSSGNRQRRNVFIIVTDGEQDAGGTGLATPIIPQAVQDEFRSFLEQFPSTLVLMALTDLRYPVNEGEGTGTYMQLWSKFGKDFSNFQVVKFESSTSQISQIVQNYINFDGLDFRIAENSKMFLTEKQEMELKFTLDKSYSEEKYLLEYRIFNKDYSKINLQNISQRLGPSNFLYTVNFENMKSFPEVSHREGYDFPPLTMRITDVTSKRSWTQSVILASEPITVQTQPAKVSENVVFHGKTNLPWKARVRWGAHVQRRPLLLEWELKNSERSNTGHIILPAFPSEYTFSIPFNPENNIEPWKIIGHKAEIRFSAGSAGQGQNSLFAIEPSSNSWPIILKQQGDYIYYAYKVLDISFFSLVIFIFITLVLPFFNSVYTFTLYDDAKLQYRLCHGDTMLICRKTHELVLKLRSWRVLVWLKNESNDIDIMDPEEHNPFIGRIFSYFRHIILFQNVTKFEVRHHNVPVVRFRAGANNGMYNVAKGAAGISAFLWLILFLLNQFSTGILTYLGHFLVLIIAISAGFVNFRVVSPGKGVDSRFGLRIFNSFVVALCSYSTILGGYIYYLTQWRGY